MIPKPTLVSALLVAAAATACSSTRSAVPVDPDVSDATPSTRAIGEPEGESYTLVLMRTGDGLHVPSSDELATLTVDHGAFMDVLTDEGYLLAAGPIVPPRVDAELRTMFLVDSDDAAAAQERLCADPPVEIGLFRIEAMEFVTQTHLRALAAMERTNRIERTTPLARRPYVAVTAPRSAALDAVLAQMDDVVLFSGACKDGTFAGMTVAFLDCSTVDEARRLMSAAGPETQTYGYHAWVAPVTVAEMN